MLRDKAREVGCDGRLPLHHTGPCEPLSKQDLSRDVASLDLCSARITLAVVSKAAYKEDNQPQKQLQSLSVE